MERFHGTAARQLVLIDEADEDRVRALERAVLGRASQRGHRLRLMQKDMYAELARRRRRAQIAARRWVDRPE